MPSPFRVLLTAGFLCALPLSAQVVPGESLLRRFNAAHRGQWFTTLTFTQHTTFPGTTRPPETWYETMRRPGFLRLDAEREGRMISRTIFRNDSVYATGANGNVVARPQVHDLLVLLHDLHVGDPDALVRTVRQAGYDLARVTATRWNDRPITVVGTTTPTDSLTRQFWVDDAARMVVRVRERMPDGSLRDIRIGKLTDAGRGWVEQEVLVFSNGQPTLVEDYRDVRVDIDIPMSVFDPAGTTLPEWVIRARAGDGQSLTARAARIADSLRTAPAPPSGFTAAPVPTGDPARLAMVLRIDDGRWIPPHTHNIPKQLRVLDGTLLVGHGERIDTTGLHQVPRGGTTEMAANTAHFEGARGMTLILLEAGAGFTTTWIRSPAQR